MVSFEVAWMSGPSGGQYSFRIVALMSELIQVCDIYRVYNAANLIPNIHLYHLYQVKVGKRHL